MTLKEIATTIQLEYPGTVCKVKLKENQIWLQSDRWPDETFLLLSPHYQNRIRDGMFNDLDMKCILIEVDRIQRWGY